MKKVQTLIMTINRITREGVYMDASIMIDGKTEKTIPDLFFMPTDRFILTINTEYDETRIQPREVEVTGLQVRPL